MSETIIMPQLGETVAEGKILTWFKAVGDDIKLGDRLFEVETDKVTVEVEAVVAGKLTDIRVGNGGVAPVGAVVAVIGGEARAAVEPAAAEPAGRLVLPARVEPVVAPPMAGADPAGLTPFAAVSGATSKLLDSGVGPAGSDPIRQPMRNFSAFNEVSTPIGSFAQRKSTGGLHLTPAARRLVSEHGLDADAIGRQVVERGGRAITGAHVREAMVSSNAMVISPSRPMAMAKPAAPKAAVVEGEIVALSPMRQKIGERLAENWRTIPHVFQAIEVDFTRIEDVRAARKERFRAAHGASLTYLPFIARATCLALTEFPRINARFENATLTIAPSINLGIAVDLNHSGLVVPVVRDAGSLNLQGLALAILRQVEKARGNKLGADDFAGGTYSISNNGAFGTAFTAPIINAPQVAILSTDAIRKRPAIVTTAEGEFVAARLTGFVGQSFDHRVFDGAYSAAFLSRLKEIIEGRDWAAEFG